MAIGLDPNNGKFLATLGAIHYRNGSFQAAREILTQAARLRDNKRERPVLRREGTGRSELYFLAMANERLGDSEAATNWLELAEAWRIENAPDDAELQLLSEEARALHFGTVDGPSKQKVAIR